MSGQSVGGSASIGLVAQSGNWIMRAADGSGNLLSSTAGALNVSLTTAIPAGANTIGSLIANQSVNVSQVVGSTVDINHGTGSTGTIRVTLASDSTGNIATIGTSVTPGTGSANLGKAIDNVVGATDTGVAALVRRKDALAGLTPADGDYVCLQVNNQGALWTQISSPINLNATATDDGVFSVGTGSVFSTGFLADDTATDSVDEGDVGIARMSLDRKQIIAGGYVDDTAFTPAGSNSYVMMMGAQADETSPDSVDEGDAGALRMTLTRFLKVSLGDLISGEDQTNNLMQVISKPVAVSTYTPDIDVSAAAEASSVTKASAGVLYSVTFSNGNAATRYFQVFDSTTVPADATVPKITFACAAGQTISLEWPKGRFFSTGIAWCTSSTQNTKTIGAADALADVGYK